MAGTSLAMTEWVLSVPWSTPMRSSTLRHVAAALKFPKIEPDRPQSCFAFWMG